MSKKIDDATGEIINFTPRQDQGPDTGHGADIAEAAQGLSGDPREIEGFGYADQDQQQRGQGFKLLGGFAEARFFDRDPRYLLKGLLGPGDFSLVYGPSGSGKSFFLLSMLAHISSGADTFLSRRIPKGGAHVLGIFCEGQANIQKRLAAIHQELGDTLDLENAKFDWIADAPQISDAEGVNGVLDTCEAYKREHGHYPELIAIDTLSRTFGAGDENSSQAMMAFVQGCQEIQRATGAHVLVVHHTGKSTEAGARGHSSLRAALDASLAVELDQAGNRAVRVDKAKDAEDGLRYGLKLSRVSLGYDQEGDEITSLVASTENVAKIKHSKQPRKTDIAGKAVTATIALAKTDQAHTIDTESTALDNEVMITLQDWTGHLIDKGLLEAKGGTTGGLTNSSWARRKRTLESLQEAGILRRVHGPDGKPINDKLYFNNDRLMSW